MNDLSGTYLARQKTRLENADISEYKDLGWQNGWKHVYFDKDGNVADRKDGVSVGYLTEDYPEYCKCRDSKHSCKHIQMTPSGSKNIVWCDICRITWMYDCSG